jgi:phage baseplate assembly protein W
MAENISERSISLPFRITSFGNVGSTDSEEKLWADRVMSVVATMRGERLYRPTFGTTIPKNVLDTQSSVEATIQRELLTAFSVFLPALSLSGLEVVFDKSQSSATVQVSYELPNRNISATVNAVVVIDGNAPIVEENK